MTPRITTPKILHDATRRIARQPARRTLGVAAATAVAAAGVAAMVSAASASSAHVTSPFTGAAAVSHSHGTSAPPAKPQHKAAPAHKAKAQHKAAPAHQAAPAHKAAPQHKAAPARKAAPRHAPPARPYSIYDSVTPSAIPARKVAATYATGSYAATPAQVTGHKVLWIDTTGTDYNANVLDVEPGDATPTQAASWAWHRLHDNPSPATLARIYTYRAQWPATQAAISHLPAHMRTHIRWWIADPTGTPHLVPGADATQWYWGHDYDITTATPRF